MRPPSPQSASLPSHKALLAGQGRGLGRGQPLRPPCPLHSTPLALAQGTRLPYPDLLPPPPGCLQNVLTPPLPSSFSMHAIAMLLLAPVFPA